MLLKPSGVPGSIIIKTPLGLNFSHSKAAAARVAATCESSVAVKVNNTTSKFPLTDFEDSIESVVTLGPLPSSTNDAHSLILLELSIP
mmetsp:Transcript_23927/g.26433  ORF Transcript_23927/g.26433 Transcript_23927/m.26433 type:complete len:88 (+) Transcript_23927:884-1147(+)